MIRVQGDTSKNTETAMRVWIVAGIVLIVAGAFVLLGGGSFTSRRDVITVGDLKVTAEEQQPILPWVGGLAVLAGAGLIVVGVRRKA
jgi:drug/metabolite transporter (DMT)-like permease